MSPVSFHTSIHTTIMTEMFSDQIIYPEQDDLFARYFHLYNECYLLKEQLSRDGFLSSPCCSSPTTSEASSPTLEDNQSTLMSINCQLKAELTSLLNCDTVKTDGQLRAWVQDRLMEVEKDSRQQRRRRKSNASRQEQSF